MTKLFETANIVDVPFDLSTPFDYLRNSAPIRDNANRCCNYEDWLRCEGRMLGKIVNY